LDCKYYTRCYNGLHNNKGEQCYRCHDYRFLKLPEDKIRRTRQKKKTRNNNPSWQQFESEIARHLAAVPTVVEYESHRQPGSGALSFAKGDVWDSIVLNESKLRDQSTAARGHKQHTLKREYLEKIIKEAGFTKIPIYTFRFFEDEEIYTVLRFNDLLDLIHEVKLLRTELNNSHLHMESLIKLLEKYKIGE
jgi:hypothetical protein